MYERIQGQGLSPGMQDADHAGLSAEVFGIRCKRLNSASGYYRLEIIYMFINCSIWHFSLLYELIF
jgi:hypothetical protein